MARAERRRGALERHVLEHVGDAVDLGRLVARADVDPDAERGGLQARHVLADDAQAVGEGGDLDGVAHAAPNVSRTAASTAARSLSSDGAALGPRHQVGVAVGQLGRIAGGGHHGLGKLGRMRRRQGHHGHARRPVGGARATAKRHGGMRVDQLAGGAQRGGDGRCDLRLIGAAAGEQVRQRRRPA